uniref:Uncharacterized protein n=1 Tax=Manihot esculenta TaxID=3983 RepID=A0A2C9W5F2_MANES
MFDCRCLGFSFTSSMLRFYSIFSFLHSFKFSGSVPMMLAMANRCSSSRFFLSGLDFLQD